MNRHVKRGQNKKNRTKCLNAIILGVTRMANEKEKKRKEHQSTKLGNNPTQPSSSKGVNSGIPQTARNLKKMKKEKKALHRNWKHPNTIFLHEDVHSVLPNVLPPPATSTYFKHLFRYEPFQGR